MPRIDPIRPGSASPETKRLLDEVQASMGVVPNMMKILAHSPASLESYLATVDLLGRGDLPPKSREAIAILVAQINSCEYCLSVHTFLGRKAGLDQREAATVRQAESKDAKLAAALRFCRELVVNRGNVGPESLETLSRAGYGDGEIIEIISHVALNTFTNYVNIAAATELDFPRVAVAFQRDAAR